jgi:hypothetical protein
MSGGREKWQVREAHLKSLASIQVNNGALTLTGLNKMNSVSLLDRYSDMLLNVSGSFAFTVL